MLEIRLLDDVRVVAEAGPRALPRSRKARGLLAYLALSGQRQRRDTLCDLFWDAPGDPRAALRWSLAKLRPALTVGDDSALSADRHSVALVRPLVTVDVLELRAALENPGRLSDDELLAIEGRLAGDALAGLDGAGTRRFQLWLESERRAVGELRRLALQELTSRESLDRSRRLQFASRRASLDPLDDDANIACLQLLAQSAGMGDARRAFEATRDHYRAENQPETRLVAAWRQLAAERSPGDGNRQIALAADATTNDETAGSAAHALPDKPSLAVLDFANLGSRDDGEILARGLVVDLTSRLAQMPGLFVIARQSAARVSAMQANTRDTGSRLGVRYLVAGSVQRDADHVRTTVRLVDAIEDEEVWADHFDYRLDDIFAVQDEITDAVIAAIEPAIEHAEMQRSLIKTPDSLTAWELFHRGLWHCFRFTVNDNEAAHRFFRQAIDLDPRFARAHAGLSFTHYSRAFLAATPDVEREIREAMDASRRSIDYDSRDSMGHWSLGRALFLSRRHDEAMMAIDHALDINPNYAQGHYAKGFVGIHAGLDAEAVPSLERAQRQSPYDPLSFAMKSSRAISLANRGQVDEAVAWALRGTQEANAHFHIYAIAAACLELAGRHEDALYNARRVLDRRPDYTLELFRQSFPQKDEGSRKPLLDAMAGAGIPRRR